jgi:hypothetical protein
VAAIRLSRLKARRTGRILWLHSGIGTRNSY